MDSSDGKTGFPAEGYMEGVDIQSISDIFLKIQ